MPDNVARTTDDPIVDTISMHAAEALSQVASDDVGLGFESEPFLGIRTECGCNDRRLNGSAFNATHRRDAHTPWLRAAPDLSPPRRTQPLVPRGCRVKYPSRRWKSATVALCAFLVGEHAAVAVQKRRLPDYDGRHERTTPGDALLWITRVALFHAYVFTEFGLRRPLGALVTGAERAGVPQALYDFFTFDEAHKVGWAPTFFVDFGFKPSAGFYFFWDDALVTRNDVPLHAASWGEDWLAASITDRIHFNRSDSWSFRWEGLRRPDFRYYGEGPNSVQTNLSRYAADRIQASSSVSLSLGGSSRVDTEVGWRQVRFHESDQYRDISTLRRAAQGVFALPAGFSDGYSVGYSGVALRLDSRRPRPLGQSGLRLDLQHEQGTGPNSNTPGGWIRYRATAGAFLDLNQRARVLSLSLTTAFADSLTHNPVPFTEQVQLGGSEPMPGFLPGRLVGRSAAVATLGYHWPIWGWLDGTLQAAVGNVFDQHLAGFALSRLRFSGAIGFETAGVSDNPVQLLVGVGTETFERGTQLNTLRLAIGTKRGF